MPARPECIDCALHCTWFNIQSGYLRVCPCFKKRRDILQAPAQASSVGAQKQGRLCARAAAHQAKCLHCEHECRLMQAQRSHGMPQCH